MAGKARPPGFWNRLNPDAQAAFMKVAETRNFQAEATLIRAGDVGDWAAVLLRGSVRVLAAEDNRKIAVRRAGDIIGEQALIDYATRSATVVAETAGQALVIGRRHFDQLLQQRPHMMRVLCEVMSERLRESDQRLVADSVLHRLVRLILDLVEARGQTGTRDVPIRIKSQGDLAEALDVSRESVVRALGTLREERLVHTSRMLLVVRDVDKLRERPVR